MLASDTYGEGAGERALRAVAAAPLDLSPYLGDVEVMGLTDRFRTVSLLVRADCVFGRGRFRAWFWLRVCVFSGVLCSQLLLFAGRGRRNSHYISTHPNRTTQLP